MDKQSIDLFREACGMTGPLQLRVDYPGVADPLQWVLYQPFALIGREPRAHLQLDHDEVSRRHAYLQVVAGRVFFTDLESRMGIQWENGSRRTGWLDEQETIRIGPYSIRHNTNGQNGSAAGEADSGSAAPRFPGRQGLPDVILEFVNKTGRSSTWKMTPLLALVGRSADCRVHLIGDSVSNFHCSLVRTRLGVWVVDLFGKDGVRVNGQVVRQCRLDAGDQLRVGKFLIRVHYDTSPVVDPRQEPATKSVAASRDEIQAPAEQTQPAVTPAVQAPEIVITPTILPPAAAQPESASGLASVPGRELVPFPADQLSAAGETAHNLLVPLAHQLSLMQKQMFDQFQQAMMMMFQMFNSLQKDQIGVIRQELDHLQNLTQELNKLQSDLMQRAVPAAAAAGAGTLGAQSQPIQPSASKMDAIKPPRVAGTPSSPVLPATAGVSSAEQSTPPPDQSAEAFHLWLNDRVRAIQKDRESHWQKIANFLRKK